MKKLNRPLVYTMSLLSLILLLSAPLTLASAHLTIEDCGTSVSRFPPDVTSTHYNLTIDLNVEKSTFEGEEIISFVVADIYRNKLSHYHQIGFHANAKLTIKQVGLKDAETGDILDIKDVCQGINDVTVLTLTKKLTIGSNILLHIKYAGNYRATENPGVYKPEEPKSVDIGLTHFMPVIVRDEFNYFDDPYSRGTIDLKAIHGADLQVLSTTPQVSEELLEGDKKRTRFEETRFMSPHLVGLVAGHFDYVEQIVSSTQVRFYTPPGRSEEMRFGLDLVVRALGFVKERIGRAFPMKKLDFVSVKQCHRIAMINHGLVIVQDRSVFTSPDWDDRKFAAYTTLNALYQQCNSRVIGWRDALQSANLLKEWVDNTVRQLVGPKPESKEDKQPGCFGQKGKLKETYKKIRHAILPD